MLINRISGAFTFRRGVYKEAAHDQRFTLTAWIIAALSIFLYELGSQAHLLSQNGLPMWLLGGLLGTLGALIMFTLACAVLAWVGRTMFRSKTRFTELVRALGLALSWRALGILGLLILAFPDSTSTIRWIVLLAATIPTIIAAAFALKSVLNRDWLNTLFAALIGIVIVVLGGLLVQFLMAILFTFVF